MTLAAVITAAGYGTRLGSELPKALVPVAGEPLVLHAVRRMQRLTSAIVVTAPSTHLEEFADALRGSCASIVPGAESRQASVAAGLAALDPAPRDIVLIHDAARAFQPLAVMREAVAAVESGADGAVPVVPVVDTLVTAPASDGTLGSPVDRAGFRVVQTPQVFRARAILDAHRGGGDAATDDATLARALGYTVMATAGHEHGLKITHGADLALAEHIAALAAEEVS